MNSLNNAKRTTTMVRMFGFNLVPILAVLMAFFIIEVHTLSIEGVLRSNPKLREAWVFTERSGVMQNISSNQYGDSLTLVVPSNAAWQAVSQARKQYLLNPQNKQDLETLLLFSATDSKYFKADAQRDRSNIVTLLGVEAQIDPANNMACVVRRNGSSSECARILEWDIVTDEGALHIIDRVLFPEELLAKPQFPRA